MTRLGSVLGINACQFCARVASFVPDHAVCGFGLAVLQLTRHDAPACEHAVADACCLSSCISGADRWISVKAQPELWWPEGRCATLDAAREARVSDKLCLPPIADSILDSSVQTVLQTIALLSAAVVLAYV